MLNVCRTKVVCFLQNFKTCQKRQLRYTTKAYFPDLNISTQSISISVSNIKNNTYLGGGVAVDIFVRVESDSYIDRIEFWVDSAPKEIYYPSNKTTSVRTYFEFNADLYSDGPHIIKIIAYNIADEKAEVSIRVIVDKVAPVIVSIKWTPNPPIEDKPIKVIANIYDAGSGVKRTVLKYKIINPPSERSIYMMKQAENEWVAEIPSQKADTIIQFYIEVLDYAGNLVTSDTITLTVKKQQVFWQFLNYGLIGGAAAIIIIAVIIFVKRPAPPVKPKPLKME